MNESLRPGRPAAPELVRILRKQIRAAHRRLVRGQRPSDASVHAVRKVIKRAQATLRLLRPVLARTAFRKVNRQLRAAARALNPVRDSRVLLDTLESLADPAAGKALAATLKQERSVALLALGARSGVISDVRRALREADAQVGGWELRSDPAQLRIAVMQIHRKARRAARRARQQPTDQRLHQWRKQVKHEAFALRLLAGVSHGRIEATADEAQRLGQHLGDDHDLALLLERLIREADLAPRPTALIRAVRARRKALQRRAFNLGQMLHALEPSAFVRHLGVLDA
jgi:CHAD domain-containing protein